MKTSDKLLTGLLAVILLSLLGSTLALKAQHDLIDYHDPFYGFSQQPIAKFTVLYIEGVQQELGPTNVKGPFRPIPPDRYTTVGLVGGATYQIRVRKGTKVPYTLRSLGDTLQVRFEAQFYPETLKGEAPFTRQPFAYIIAPNVASLQIKGATCKVAQLTGPNLIILSTDARVLLSQSRISHLRATNKQGSLFQTAGNNHVQQASLVGRDTTEFIVGQDKFGSLALQLDSSSTLKAPISVFRKVRTVL